MSKIRAKNLFIINIHSNKLEQIFSYLIEQFSIVRKEVLIKKYISLGYSPGIFKSIKQGEFAAINFNIARHTR